MADMNELMADLKAADQAGDTELANHIASIIRGESEAPKTTNRLPPPEPMSDVDQFLSRLPSPKVPQGVADFMYGAAGTGRGTANIVGRLFGIDKLIDSDNVRGIPVDKESWSALGGSLIDPGAALVGGGAGKLVQGVKTLSARPVAAGISAGVLGGATVGGLSNENTSEGAVTGSVAGLAGGAAGPLLGKGVGMAVDAFKGRGPDIRAGRIMRELMGDSAVISADPSLSTAQATRVLSKGEAPIVSPELAALEASLKGYQGQGGYQQFLKQRAGRIEPLAGASGGMNAETAKTAAIDAKKILNEELDPLRVSGAENANFFTKHIVDLQKDAAKYRKAAEAAVENVRRKTATVPLGEELGMTQSKAGARDRGVRLPVRYTYGGELAERAEKAAAQSADESVEFGRLARTAEYQLERTKAHGITTLSASPLLKRIDTMRNKVGDETNPVLTKTLDEFKKYVSLFVDKDGNIDAYNLHGIRKNVNEVVDMLYPNGDPKLKGRAANVLNSLTGDIDETLKKAGGEGLVKYFQKFSQGMDDIRQMQFAADVMNMSEKKQIAIGEGQLPKAIEKIMGQGKYKLSDVPKVAEILKDNARQLSRDRALKEAAPYGEELAKKVVRENLPAIRIPNLMSRWASTGNLALQTILESLDQKTMTALSKAANNPIEAMRVMKELPTYQQQVILQAMRNSRNAGMAGGMMAGATE